MGRFRSQRKFISALAVTLCAVLLLMLLASQIEQHLFRRRAELLLSQVQSFELRKTPWQEAQLQLQRWGPNREFGNPCDAHRCSLQIRLNEFVFDYLTQGNLFVKLDDYFRWRLKLSYDQGPFVRTELWLLRLYMRVGGHPAKVTATVGMRDGIVWNKGISVWIETYAHDPEWSGNELFEFSLGAIADSVSRFEYFGGSQINPQLKLHSNYLIGRPSGCEICVEGWTKFTPCAEPSDVRRLMNLDLSCLTRWHPCVSQSDILPAAWAQYRAERALEERARSETSCPQSFLEILGRDSVNIATVELLKYNRKDDPEGNDSSVASTRLVKRLKGIPDWNVGEARKVHVWGGPGSEGPKQPTGSQLILFRGQGPSTDEWTVSPSTCPITWVNETNLSLVRRGIDQDYSALDKSQ